MRRLWHIASKELLQTRRDRLAALFTIVLPVIFTVFLGLIFGGANNDATRLPLAVADADGSPASVQFVERLHASPLVDLKAMTVGEVDTAVQDQDVAAALVIPAGYGAALEAGKPVTFTFVRIETSSGAQSLSQAVQTVVGELNSRLLATKAAAAQVSIKTGRNLDAALRSRAETLAAAALAAPVVTVKTTDSGNAIAQMAGGFDRAPSSTGSSSASSRWPPAWPGSGAGACFAGSAPPESGAGRSSGARYLPWSSLRSCSSCFSSCWANSPSGSTICAARSRC